MKLQLAALIVAAAAMLATPGANRAEAQVVSSHGAPIVDASPAYPGAITVGSAVIDQGRSFPYSYYAAFPNRAREYVPHGPADAFPFYGNPYGKPYDRWTWASMSGPPNSLQRYYYPPVR